MIIVELTYIKPIAAVDAFLKEHRDFLADGYAKGFLLASGPKNPRVGGIIISLLDRQTTEMLMEHDPFQREEIATYTYTEFEPVKYCDALRPLIEKN